MDKKTMILRENWKFHLEQAGERRGGGIDGRGYPRQAVSAAWYKGYDDSAWRSVTVPHDWSVEQPFSESYSSGTGYLAGGTGWYRVHFGLPEEYRGKSVRVVFDGVYKNSQVWCNSYYLGRRPYGYSTFSYDITHAAVFGREENVLCVKVVHEDLADSRWFTGSGITRKVAVVVEEPVHPAEYGVFFRAERIEVEEAEPCRAAGRADIVIEHRTEAAKGLSGGSGREQTGQKCRGERSKLSGDNGREAAGYSMRPAADEEKFKAAQSRIRIRTALIDAQGESVLTLEGSADAGGECVLSGTLEKAQLWSPERPYLYTLRTWYALPGSGENRSEEGETAERFYLADEVQVGIRKIVFDPEKGFFLNDTETKMKGVCVHHDGGALGAAMEPEIWQRRLEILKEGGCNAIRCSHNPHMPELYDLCDRMGFLVMDEAFDEWENAKNKWSTGHNVYPPVHEGYYEEFPHWHREDLQAMVRRDRNHPCVVMWSIGNEIDYPNDPYCHPSFAAMTGNNDADKPAAEQQYDSNKPNALRLTALAEELEEIVRGEDTSRPVTLASAFPELSAETGLFHGLDVTGYNYKEHLYERDHERFPGMPLIGSENGHSYSAWLAVRDNPYISGQFLWTGIDYLGEAHGWPVHGSSAGILTCAGYRKPEFYRRKSFWCKEPVLMIGTRRVSDGPEDWRPMESHWNYEPGEEILVKVFTNLPKVRLLLDAGEPDTGAAGEEAAVPVFEISGEGARRSWCGAERREDTGSQRGKTALPDSGQIAGVTNRREIGVLEGYNGDGAYCFRVSYRPGVLTAEGYASDTVTKSGSGAPAAVYSLSAAGIPAGAECRIWRGDDLLTGRSWEEVSAEPGYLYQIEIGLCDAQGNPAYWQEKVLTVEVDGSGVLAGLESGNLADVSPYRENRRSTFRGRLVAYVRREGQGSVGVKIYMEGSALPVAQLEDISRG